jgi:tRNA(Ile2) C34 agmatinyltransferase TiaS
MKMIFVGLDDTDNLTSRGTGHLARQIAAVLAANYPLLGVTRHQLLVDPRVPYTRKNSSAAIVLGVNDEVAPVTLLTQIKALMLADYQPDSDPGLCVAPTVSPAIIRFGRQAQTQVVTQAQARALAKEHNIPLVGLGGSEDGVIGALAAVGLAASGEDGRYVQVGRSRELSGLQPVSAVLAAGIAAVQTTDGQPVTDHLIQTDKLRPARRGGKPVAIVDWAGTYWLPLKLN